LKYSDKERESDERDDEDWRRRWSIEEELWRGVVEDRRTISVTHAGLGR
jgi:hypothetical protein